MKPKKIEAITLDWKEFSQEAFQEFKKALKSFSLYMGDILEDYEEVDGGNGTDTYCIYIAKRKMSPKELKEEFPMLIPDDDDDQMELFDRHEYKE